MYFLAIDTSSLYFSAAISVGNKILAYKKSGSKNKHSEESVLIIESLLEKLGAEYKDIDTISFMTGPGSSTGIRIGKSIINALSLLYDINIICIKNTELIFNSCKNQVENYDFILAMIDVSLFKCHLEIMNQYNEIIESCTVEYTKMNEYFLDLFKKMPEISSGINVASGSGATKYFFNLEEDFKANKEVKSKISMVYAYSCDAKRMMKITKIKSKNKEITHNLEDA